MWIAIGKYHMLKWLAETFRVMPYHLVRFDVRVEELRYLIYLFSVRRFSSYRD